MLCLLIDSYNRLLNDCRNNPESCFYNILKCCYKDVLGDRAMKSLKVVGMQLGCNDDSGYLNEFYVLFKFFV